MPRKPTSTRLRRRASDPPPLKVGDCIAYGPCHLSGTVVEDRGFIGIDGRQIVRIAVPLDEGEPPSEQHFELPAVMLERRPTPPVVIAMLQVPISIGLDAGLLERAHKALNMHYLGRPQLKSLKEEVSSEHLAASYAVHRSCRTTLTVELRADGSLGVKR